jgi:regulator of sirC expression with transglutaminase-like and TPR domain
MKKFLLILNLFMFFFAFASEKNSSTIYKTIPPTSLTKHLAFYELYPNTKEGKEALKEAWALLCQNGSHENEMLFLPKIDLNSIIQIVIKTPLQKPIFQEEDLILIEKLSKHLKNRVKKTHLSWREEDFIKASPEDIDLARGLFIAEMGVSEESKQKIRYYEACIDLIALQISANLPKNPTPFQKIKAINEFIFFEMGFRFPPLSNYSKEIDSYTFLPSVIDKRKGVCLGISILYLCIAQRLDLPLEPVTPPGHIFARYKIAKDEYLNIETTARGIDVPTEEYLSIETKQLQTRNYKEVIGLAFMNEASIHLKEKGFEKAASLYEKALKYLPNDFLIKQLLGCSYLFTNREVEGKKLLKEIENYPSLFHVSSDNLAADFLAKKVDVQGLKAVFIPYDDEREAIISKKNELQKVLEKHPHFRMGLMLLANTWLQLGRTKEALEVLKNYYEKEPKDPVVNFYLTMIYFERFDYKNSWKFLRETEEAFKPLNYYPKVLKNFRRSLSRCSME